MSFFFTDCPESDAVVSGRRATRLQATPHTHPIRIHSRSPHSAQELRTHSLCACRLLVARSVSEPRRVSSRDRKSSRVIHCRHASRCAFVLPSRSSGPWPPDCTQSALQWECSKCSVDQGRQADCLTWHATECLSTPGTCLTVYTLSRCGIYG
jgi:hypothetical protein